MDEARRSGCPINLTLEGVGDKWSLLIIRDMMFGNRRHFRELLTKSDEGISSNILADRLKTLLEQGVITREDDPSHKQKGIYSLTNRASNCCRSWHRCRAGDSNISRSAKNSASAPNY